MLHLGVSDPARRAIWAFFALYVFVALGSTHFLLQLAWHRKRAIPAA